MKWHGKQYFLLIMIWNVPNCKQQRTLQCKAFKYSDLYGTNWNDHVTFIILVCFKYSWCCWGSKKLRTYKRNVRYNQKSRFSDPHTQIFSIYRIYTECKERVPSFMGIQYSFKLEKNPSQHTHMSGNHCLLRYGRFSCHRYSRFCTWFPCFSMQISALRCTKFLVSLKSHRHSLFIAVIPLWQCGEN
jgi:hypothetical protein